MAHKKTKTSMDKTIAKHLDSILIFLSKAKEPNCLWTSMINSLGIDINLSDSLLSALESNKYVIITDFSGGRKLVRLSPEGKAFILNSSFLSEESKDNRKQMKSNFTFIIDIIAKIFAIVGVSSTIYLGLLNRDKNQIINDIESKNKKLIHSLDSIKNVNDSLIHNTKIKNLKND